MSSVIRYVVLGLVILVAIVVSLPALSPRMDGTNSDAGPGETEGAGEEGGKRAESDRARMSGMPQVNFWITLSRAEVVQEELALSDEQKHELQIFDVEYQERIRDAMAAGRDLSPPARRAKMREQAKDPEEIKGLMREILSPEQFQRLAEIACQFRLAHVLADTEFQDAIGLSPAQRDEAGKIRMEGMRKIRESRQHFAGSKGGRQVLRALQETMHQEAFALLAAEQKAKLEQMKGVPFEVDVSALNPGGRRALEGGSQPAEPSGHDH